MRFLLISALFIIVGCNSLPLDPMNAAEAGDFTVAVSGCGKGSSAGYLFCRLSEGSKPTSRVTIFLPELNCDKEHCYEVTPLTVHGQTGAAIGTNSTVSISLNHLTGSDQPLTMAEDGEARVLVRGFYMGDDDIEYQKLGRALVRIVVMRKGYVAAGCNNPYLAFSVETLDGKNAFYTTGFRSVICE